MTKQQIEELAGHRHVPDWIVKLVGDAVAREREECAKVCEAIDVEYEGEDVLATWCAAAIRARGRSEALTNLNKAAEDMGQEL